MGFLSGLQHLKFQHLIILLNESCKFTQIYDRNGVILYDVHENIRRTVVQGNIIDSDIKEAVIAIEDKDFYSHQVRLKLLLLFEEQFHRC